MKMNCLSSSRIITAIPYRVGCLGCLTSTYTHCMGANFGWRCGTWQIKYSWTCVSETCTLITKHQGRFNFVSIKNTKFNWLLKLNFTSNFHNHYWEKCRIFCQQFYQIKPYKGLQLYGANTCNTYFCQPCKLDVEWQKSTYWIPKNEFFLFDICVQCGGYERTSKDNQRIRNDVINLKECDCKFWLNNEQNWTYACLLF